MCVNENLVSIVVAIPTGRKKQRDNYHIGKRGFFDRPQPKIATLVQEDQCVQARNLFLVLQTLGQVQYHSSEDRIGIAKKNAK